MLGVGVDPLTPAIVLKWAGVCWGIGERMNVQLRTPERKRTTPQAQDQGWKQAFFISCPAGTENPQLHSTPSGHGSGCVTWRLVDDLVGGSTMVINQTTVEGFCLFVY